MVPPVSRPYWEDKRLVAVPGAAYDDDAIISLALEKDALVITNDRFADHVRNGRCTKEWCDSHLCNYYWIHGDEFVLVRREML